MPIYKVYYRGYYYVEADSADEALETNRDDGDVRFEEWENYGAEEQEDDNAE